MFRNAFTTTAALSVASLALAACSADTPETESTQALNNSPPVIMNFVAHQDDDLLFMNPDVQNLILTGWSNITVYVTAGEAEGAPGQDRFTFAGWREQGARAAYARMANVSNSWTHGTLTVAGYTVQVDTLTAAPRIKLVFLRLPDAGDSDWCGQPGCANALPNLFLDSSGTGFLVPTIVPTYPSGSVTISSPGPVYDRNHFVAVLGGLLSTYQPTIVRALDPQPYKRCYNNAFSPFPMPPDCTNGWSDPARTHAAAPMLHVTYDNVDHSTVGGFVDEALESYHGPYNTAKYTLLNYKGYSIEDGPGNLGTSEYSRKYDTFVNYYMPWDGNAQSSWSGETAAGAPYFGYHAWIGATFERYPATSTWTALVGAQLYAFAVQDRQLVMWNENAVGGSWAGPTQLGGGPLSPSLTVVSTATTTTVVGLTLPQAQDAGSFSPQSPRQAVVYNVLNNSTRTWSGWQSLGNPDDRGGSPCGESAFGFDAPGCTWLGTPTAAVDSTGTLYVFVRNDYGKVSYRTPAGSWQVLPDPNGGTNHNYLQYDAMEGMAAIEADDGTIHVFSTMLDGWIAHWWQTAPGGGFSVDGSFPAGNPIGNAAGPPTVTKNQDGRLEIFYHDFGYADVYTAFQSTTGGWSTNLVNLNNTSTGGTGPLAAMRRSTGQIMLFSRNGYDGISTNWQVANNSSFSSTWTDLGGMTSQFASAANDVNGNAVLGVLGIDNSLWIRRETCGIGSFAGFQRVGDAPNLVTPTTTITVSSSYEGGPWGKAKVNDGSQLSMGTSYGWASFVPNKVNHTEWLEIDFPVNKTFNEVVLYPRADCGQYGVDFPIDFRIQVWNGASWIDRVVKTGYGQPNGPQSFTWGASDTTNKIRVYATNLRYDSNTDYGFQLAEVEVFQR